jgi:type IV pilus assembly protein PilY1
MGDPMSVDIDISAAQCSAGSCTYSPDVFYIGNSQGKLWRINSTGIWSAGTESTVLDLGTTKPIIAAPSASEDDDGRLWLYFGTGRFLADTDKTNTDTQSLVGVKEPLDWNDCDSDSDTTDLTIYCASPATIPSSNLLDVTNYTVYEGRYVDEGDGGTYDTTFSALVDDMKQYASDTATPRPYDGWIVNLTGGERCITKPTILGGIVTFPTFDPRLQDSTCGLTGESFLYALYYKTGTAYYKSIIGYGDDTVTVDSETYKEISKKVTLGRGMASAPSLHVGQNKGARAFAQSTTGEIFLIEEKLPGAYKSRPLHWIERSH